MPTEEKDATPETHDTFQRRGTRVHTQRQEVPRSGRMNPRELHSTAPEKTDASPRLTLDSFLPV